jgi:thymidylate synthase
MITNSFQNLEMAFIGGLSKIKNDGYEIITRNAKVLEVLHANFLILDPSDLNIVNPIRKFSVNYALSEWLWYLSKNKNANSIGKLATIWNNIKDENNEVESNYGTYLYQQWQWVINELLNDPNSRRATIVINQPYHKNKNKLDYPCTHYIQFFIRDNKLHLSVNMRSNDIIYGFCNDVFTFSLFLQLMLNELNQKNKTYTLGSYYHHAGSLHIYEHHFKMMDNILNNTKSLPLNTKKFKLKSDFLWDSINTDNIFQTNKNSSKEEIKTYTNDKLTRLFV